MNESNSSYIRKYSGIWLIFLVLALMIGAVFPMSAPVKDDLELNNVMGALGAIFIIVLLVERATEIIISIWRQPDAEAMKTDIHKFKKDKDGNQEKECLKITKKLAAYRTTTKHIALFFSFSLSIIICMAGVGLLEVILNYPTGDAGMQKSFLRAVDILLTASLLAGGSDAFHQFTSTLEEFFAHSKKQMDKNAQT